MHRGRGREPYDSGYRLCVAGWPRNSLFADRPFVKSSVRSDRLKLRAGAVADNSTEGQPGQFRVTTLAASITSGSYSYASCDERPYQRAGALARAKRYSDGVPWDLSGNGTGSGIASIR